MTCQVIVDLKAKADAIDKVKAWLRGALPVSRGDPGCVSLAVVQDLDDPTSFMLVEQWESRPIYETYLQWRVDRGDVEVFGALMDGPMSIRYFDYCHL